MTEKKEKISQNRFFYKALDYLRSEFDSAKEKTDKELKEQVEKGVKKAFSYGLETELDVMGFVDMQWRLGFDFDVNKNIDWVQDILKDGKLNPQEKISTLRNAYAAYEAMKEE